MLTQGIGFHSGESYWLVGKMHSTYDSVQEQTGLFAGKGGFDVKVGEHTQLNGAVIGSTASAEHNRLETGTLGFSDIENQAAYKVEHQSVGASTGGGMANFIGNLANGLAVAGNKEKSDSSTTHAAVSDGTIIINDTAKQQQNVDDLSRDVAHANQTLSPIFDKEKEQQRMQTLQLIGEIGNQAADIARTQGEIAGLKAQSDPVALEAARAELVRKGHANPTSEQIAEKAYHSAKATFGTGSAIQQAITASTAAIQGLAGGDITKALAGGTAPYIAEVIHRQTISADGEVNKTANLMAHAVVNAALSLAKGENALAGASSAVTAEAVGLISQAYYGKKASELDESQKQTISALASLAAGLAGGLVGGDTASAVSGMQTGKVTVENNYLSTTEKSRQTELNYKQNLTPQEKQERDALNRKDSDSDMAVYLACNKGGGDCQAERAKAKEAQDTYFNQTYLNPKEAQAGYKQIENLLESTDPNAKAVFNILDGYTQAFMTFGYTEEEARARAGTYVGSIYVLGGMSAVLSSNSLTKQFGKDVAGDAKPSGNTTPKIDTGKVTTGQIAKNSDGIHEVTVNKTPLEAHDRLNTPDLGGSGKLKPAEAASAAQLESSLGKMERYTPPKGATSGTSPDFVITSGQNKGKTVDAMYTTDRLSQKEIDGLNKFYEKNMSTGNGKIVIQEHLKKADFVPVDFRVLTPPNQKIFIDYIQTLPKAQQDKIIIVR